MKTEALVKSANWHITSKCNYNCKFCYVQKLRDFDLKVERASYILDKLSDAGIEKINFVGGEPLLHPLIFDLVKLAKDQNFIVSITTNGSKINEDTMRRLSSYVDWIGLSVDSISNEVEKKLGRGPGNHISKCISASDLVHETGIRLKANTTVTKITYREIMTPLIHRLDPERWKVFQVLHIEGQNDQYIKQLAVTKEEFDVFVKNHRSVRLNKVNKPVFEKNSDMTNSYLMLNPEGNIFQNTGGRYSEYPLKTLTTDSIRRIVDVQTYVSRNGIYDWN